MMKSRLQYVITEEENGCLLREILRGPMGVSRSLLSSLKTHPRGILVDGTPRTVRHVVQQGEVVIAAVDRPGRTSDIPLEAGELDIRYEDKDVLVVDKAPGQKMYPTFREEKGSLAASILSYLDRNKAGSVFHPVSRLDQGTAGLVLIAKSRFSAGRLQATVRDKRYAAVVFGKCAPSGHITVPIGRRPNPITGLGHMQATAAGKAALTVYHRLWYDEIQQASGLAVEIRTGRRHQIRVHFSHLGHPLWGDTQYGGPFLTSGYPLLYAVHLRFRQPRTGEWQEVTVQPRLRAGEPPWAWRLFQNWNAGESFDQIIGR